MPSRTRHPIFDNRTRKDTDDELIDAGVGNSISSFADHIFGLAKKHDEVEEDD